VGHFEKVSLALGQYWTPDRRRLIAADLELLSNESDDCLKRDSSGREMQPVQGRSCHDRGFGQLAVDLKMGRRHSSRWVSEIVIVKDPPIAILVKLIGSRYNFADRRR
jgi:hypothetical protein